MKNVKDFKKTLILLKDYLTTIAIIQHSRSEIYILDKMINGEAIKIANKIHVYFGIYDGRIKPVDHEAKGILYYTIPELDDEMKKFPKTFTHDMHVLMKELRSEIEDFVQYLALNRDL